MSNNLKKKATNTKKQFIYYLMWREDVPKRKKKIKAVQHKYLLILDYWESYYENVREGGSFPLGTIKILARKIGE